MFDGAAHATASVIINMIILLCMMKESMSLNQNCQLVWKKQQTEKDARCQRNAKKRKEKKERKKGKKKERKNQINKHQNGSNSIDHTIGNRYDINIFDDRPVKRGDDSRNR
jgi:hypothetical protein